MNSFLNRIPPVTKNLIIINFLVWIAMMVLPSRLGMSLETFGGLHYLTASDFNPAQFITYMFMHSTGSFAHIFFNMFMLLMFGATLERALGSARFLFYYISCGVGAAIIQEITWALSWETILTRMIAMQNNMDFPEARAAIEEALMTPQGEAIIKSYLNVFVTIGASGAVYGLLLAFGMMFPNAPMYFFFIPVAIKAKWMTLGMGAIELLIGLSESVGRSDGVAHFAHLGGMIFGFFIILYWKKKGTFDGNSWYN